MFEPKSMLLEGALNLFMTQERIWLTTSKQCPGLTAKSVTSEKVFAPPIPEAIGLDPKCSRHFQTPQ